MCNNWKCISFVKKLNDFITANASENLQFHFAIGILVNGMKMNVNIIDSSAEN